MASPVPLATWKAYYLDGKSAKRQEVQVRLEGDILLFVWKQRTQRWPLRATQLSQGHYAGESARLELAEAALVIEDPSFLQALHRLNPYASEHLHDPSKRFYRIRLLAYAALASLLCLFLLYRFVIPGLARGITARMPLSIESAMGDSAAQVLAPEQKQCKDRALHEALDTILKRLLSKQGDFPYKVKILVLRSKQVNAFALPGGTVVVLTGLLERTKSPEELAGVLAHELQHVRLRHSTQRLFEESFTALLIGLVSGDAVGSGIFGARSAQTLALLHYSREQEAEADREGMKMILAAGLNPQGMIDFFEGLEKKESGGANLNRLSFLSDHPGTADRIRDLQLQASGAKAETSPALLPGTSWKRLCIRCSILDEADEKE